MPLELQSLSLGDVTVSGKGTKQIPLRCKDGLLRFQPGPLRVLWEPQAYQDPTATRVPICFEVTPEVEQYIKALDSWVVQKLAADSQTYFGQPLALDQVQDRYERWDDLLSYCRESADPVGRLVLGVLGEHDPAAIAASDAICTALQLTNHWQDARRDLINMFTARHLRAPVLAVSKVDWNVCCAF